MLGVNYVGFEEWKIGYLFYYKIGVYSSEIFHVEGRRRKQGWF
jgi:hypothetical protein